MHHGAVSGYVAKDLGDGRVRVEYVVQFNPGGWVTPGMFGVKATDQLEFLAVLRAHFDAKAQA